MHVVIAHCGREDSWVWCLLLLLSECTPTQALQIMSGNSPIVHWYACKVFDKSVVITTAMKPDIPLNMASWYG